MKEFMKALETERQLSTVYHSQINGQTERINQKIGTFIQYYMNYQQDNWTDQLAVAEFQYNDKKYTITGRTPFKLNFGRHPQKGNFVVQMKIPRVEESLTGIQKGQEQATKAMEKAQKNIKRQFNKKRWNPQELKVGDNMWLENKNIQSN